MPRCCSAKARAAPPIPAPIIATRGDPGCGLCGVPSGVGTRPVARQCLQGANFAGNVFARDVGLRESRWRSVVSTAAASRFNRRARFCFFERVEITPSPPQPEHHIIFMFLSSASQVVPSADAVAQSFIISLWVGEFGWPETCGREAHARKTQTRVREERCSMRGKKCWKRTYLVLPVASLTGTSGITMCPE